MGQERKEKYTICVLPGDGIGPEVIEVAVNVLKALDVDFDFVYGDIGFGAYEKLGDALPQKTLELVEKCDATLFGAVTTPPNIPNYRSPILRLRQHFQLYANVRPCVSVPCAISKEGIDLVIFRENTEGLYSGIERVEEDGEKAITERVITKKGSERIVRYAFEHAKKQGRRKVTLVHKANVLRETCGLFRKVGLSVAEEYPDITYEEYIVDACAMHLIRSPQDFDVIVTTNLFGDILSDEACMLVGGLGLAYSGNIGEQVSVFESVHGSAPPLVGTGKANPLATIRAAVFMLEHLGLVSEAKKVDAAIRKTLVEGNVTPDLGGSCTTKEVGEHIIAHLNE